MKISEDKASMIIKLNFLLLGLGLVVYAIWYLNARGLPPKAAAVLNMPATSTPEGKVSVNFCPTRVTEIAFDKNSTVFEEKMRWKVRKGSEAQDLPNQVEIEKWFSIHCYILGYVAKAVNPDIQPVAMFGYVDGTESLLFYEAEAGVFLFGDTSFKSVEMVEALQELADMASLENPLKSL